jgi:hypothetical protein
VSERHSSPYTWMDADQKSAQLATARVNARDGVHEGNVDPNGLRNQIFHFSQHCQLILGLDVIRVSSVQARNQASERRYSDSLANAQDR